MLAVFLIVQFIVNSIKKKKQPEKASQVYTTAFCCCYYYTVYKYHRDLTPANN